MTRIILPILGGLLALVAGVDAKSKKDMVHLYQFTSDDCLDTPSGGNVDLERDECVKINARSLTLKIDSKRKKWLDEINQGKHMCAVTIYRDSGCMDDPKDNKVVTHLLVPHEMDKCHTEEEMPVHWAKFHCGPHISNDETVSSSLVTTTSTSWSVGKNDRPTPYTTTKTFYAVTTLPGPSNVAHRLEPREEDNGDKAWVWMHHPWSGSLLCYKCWTQEKGKHGWVKCTSGPHILSQCGVRPADNLDQANTTTTVAGTTHLTSTIVDGTFTTTETITATTTESVFTTTTVITQNVTSTIAMPLEARKNWRKRVTFTNPWDRQRMCADAEWEKRGKVDAEVRIEKVRYESSGEGCSSELSIDAPGPEIFSDHTSTTRTGYTNIATVTSTLTATVMKSSSATSSTATTIWPAGMAAADEEEAVPHSDL